VNAWVRTSGAFDGVIDFDVALRDPARAYRLRPDYDSGDHVHPSDAGYAAMGAAVALSPLKAAAHGG
jgi:lysophospholipase L1-like esterase